ncbi:MAG TPA: glycosyltransferase [Armatimonadota bacterium]
MWGKFLRVNGRLFLVKGVTYGTFAESEDGYRFPDEATVHLDFRLMREAGVNTIRTYTVPPRYLLDAAREHGLHVIVGTFWEARRLMYDSATDRSAAKAEVTAAVRACRNHPAVLMYCIGNEVPPDIIRWYGQTVIEGFLRELTDLVHREDPGSLVTFANYPPAEYLDLSFLDVITFNVYLEREPEFRSYLARLQSLAGDKPILLGESGLDSMHSSEEKQAETLEWLVKAVFQKGLCGITLFGWTDEWVVGDRRVEDWRFGIVDEARRPKAAYATVQQLYTGPLYAMLPRLPRISVVIAAYNASDTIAECLDSFARVEYPDYEVLVIDDGSTDQTASIAGTYAEPIRLLQPGRGGLSFARNAGMDAATGEIVAYTDADCVLPPHWLFYLAASFTEGDWSAVGGPNLLPENDNAVARAVDRCPGIATHVLMDDEEAEHVPGCNMAFKTDVLRSLGGFNTIYRTAGDDVDMCWRVLSAGYRIGFNHGAMVWHHRRPNVKRYLGQQRGYGFAEALLHENHPDRFNALGGIKWLGSLYDGPLHRLKVGRRVHYGEFGAAMFQSVYYPHWTNWAGLALTPEWYAVVLAAAALAASVFMVVPYVALLFASVAVCGLAGTIFVGAQAASDGARRERGGNREKAYQWWLVFRLHLLQPVYRSIGRLKGTRFRTQARRKKAATPSDGYWASWIDRPAFLYKVAYHLQQMYLDASSGDGWERWDLKVSRLAFVTAYVDTAVHEQTVLRTRVTLALTPWFWLLLGPILAVTTFDIDDPAAALGVNLGILGIFVLMAWGQARLYRRLIAYAEDQAAHEMGWVPLRYGGDPVPAESAAAGNAG